MIKFFRKIRQKLLVDNRFNKYLIYAIGEIVLVVIGILIALQINDWNQNNKDQKLEQQYYCRLLEDVHQDLSNYNDYVVLLNDRINASNTLIQRLQDDAMPLDSIAPLVLKSIKYSIRDIKATTDAFEDIKSSGNLNIIKDLSIKNKLANYYKTLANTSNVIVISGTSITDKRFFESDDLISSGWIKLIEDFNTIDTKKVNYELLKSNINFNKEIRKNMLNDAIFYLGINSRSKQLLTRLEKDIVAMIEVLNAKCEISDD